MILETREWRQALRFCETTSHHDTDDESIEQCSILQVCLGPQIPSTACKETTPFRELIKNMPGMYHVDIHIYYIANGLFTCGGVLCTELAKLVLDKCCSPVLNQWKYVYDYEFVEDFQNLFSKKECGKGMHIMVFICYTIIRPDYTFY